MASILDYLNWRGDLTFPQSPFCDVDALILSRLSYVPFYGIVSDDFQKDPVPLAKAATLCIDLVHDKNSGRAFRMKDDEALLSGLRDSPRFAELLLAGHVNTFNAAKEEQFSATSILLPAGETFVSFRGTDGTLVGWKEDFNMGFADVVPAQRDAVAYLERAAAAFPGKLRVGGHSKGGNLAVYASAFCEQGVQDRILAVRNHDGPGFLKENIEKDGFRRVIDRVKTYLPQSSIVGMLLEHEEDYSVIHSTNQGIMQHDVYSWEVRRAGFVGVEERTNSSQLIDMTLKDWMRSMTPELREKMIDGVFSVLGASDGMTLRDLLNGKNTIAVLRAMTGMDDETRELLKHAYSLLKSSAKKSLPVLLDRYLEDVPVLAGLVRPDGGKNGAAESV